MNAQPTSVTPAGATTALLVGPAVSRPGRPLRPSAGGSVLMPPFVPSRSRPLQPALPGERTRGGAESLRLEADPPPLADRRSDDVAAVEHVPDQPQTEHEPDWSPMPATPAEAGAFEAAASDRAWLDSLDWGETAAPASLQPPREQEQIAEHALERPGAAELPATGSAVTAAAPEFDLVVPGAAVHDVLTEPLDDVADRLERIAGRLRRRAAGDLVPDASSSADPLELLLTGFVLGYISQQDTQPRRRRPDAG